MPAQASPAPYTSPPLNNIWHSCPLEWGARWQTKRVSESKASRVQQQTQHWHGEAERITRTQSQQPLSPQICYKWFPACRCVARQPDSNRQRTSMRIIIQCTFKHTHRWEQVNPPKICTHITESLELQTDGIPILGKWNEWIPDLFCSLGVQLKNLSEASMTTVYRDHRFQTLNKVVMPLQLPTRRLSSFLMVYYSKDTRINPQSCLKLKEWMFIAQASLFEH